MNNLVVSNIFRFFILILLQILMLNFVSFGGYMLPFVYVLAVLMLPTRLGKIPTLVIAFAAGLLVDIFCNVLGFHAFCCTLLAFARILFGNRMLTRDEPADIDIPSVHSVPFAQFSGYLFVMSLIYCAVYFLLEAFSFSNFWPVLLSIVLSTLLTWALMLLMQLLIPQNKK